VRDLLLLLLLSENLQICKEKKEIQEELQAGYVKHSLKKRLDSEKVENQKY
jgi:hypothetical protein